VQWSANRAPRKVSGWSVETFYDNAQFFFRILHHLITKLFYLDCLALEDEGSTERREPFTQRHGVTSQKICSVNSTALRTSNVVQSCSLLGSYLSYRWALPLEYLIWSTEGL
jgi:hypothetical protein